MENLPLHEVGLLRGAMKDHDARYFGSLLALDRHVYLRLRRRFRGLLDAVERAADSAAVLVNQNSLS
ncbi:hypothetical protein [Streptomyces sp. NPDC004830]